jgi:hypothetical protein
MIFKASSVFLLLNPAIASVLSLRNSTTATASLFSEHGGPIVCRFKNTDKNDCFITQKCCDEVNHKAYFSSAQHACIPNAGPGGNSVDTGKMVECCGKYASDSNA